MPRAAGHVFIASSLDGYIARSDGDISWLHDLPNIGSDYGYSDFMDRMDGIVMGRGTFEKVLSFGIGWPYTKRVIVLSQSLKVLPDNLGTSNVVLSRETPVDLMARLGREGWQAAYVDGGRVISSFLSAGLIDDMTISRVPILLGSGLPLFSGLTGSISLEHVETCSFSSGLVQTRYRVRRSGE